MRVPAAGLTASSVAKISRCTERSTRRQSYWGVRLSTRPHLLLLDPCRDGASLLSAATVYPGCLRRLLAEAVSRRSPSRVPSWTWTSPTRPKQRSSAAEIAGWLREQSARGMGQRGLRHDSRTSARSSTTSGRPSCSMGVGSVPAGPSEYGGQGPFPAPASRAERGIRPGGSTSPGRFLWRHSGWADNSPVGQRGAEAAVHSRHPQGRDRLVPGLQRARRGFRPGQPQDPRRAGRRRMGHQRPKGLDHPGAVRRLHLLAGPDGSRRAQTRRDLVSPRSDEAARSRGATRSSRSTGRRSSTRSSSPTCAARRTTWWAGSTTGGRSP